MSQSTSTFEHSYYIGNYMGAILYGAYLVFCSCDGRTLTCAGCELTLYYLILQGLFRRGNRNSARSRRFCSIYSTMMVLLSTINVSCNAIWGEEMWITDRDDPGGVARYIETEVSVWYETLASVAVVTCVFLGDALLVCRPLIFCYFGGIFLLLTMLQLYRLFLVYGSRFAVVAVPLIAYIIAFGKSHFIALLLIYMIYFTLKYGYSFGRDTGRCIRRT